MNRKLRVFIVIASILILGATLAYKFLLPVYLAHLVTLDNPPSYLPEKYKNQLERIHKPISKYTGEIFRISDSLNFSLDFILRTIDSVDSDEVLAVYYKLENKNVTNSDEVFDIILKEIKIKQINMPSYRKVFVKFATPARINRGLRYVEQHELISTLAPSTAKKIAKQLVMKHYNSKKDQISPPQSKNL